MFEIADLKSEAPHEMPLDEKLGEWPSKGEVSFVNVSMRYRENTDLVLRDLNMDIMEGSKVGCVGRTGSGKSTIL